jgi:hypothetical protein
VKSSLFLLVLVSLVAAGAQRDTSVARLARLRAPDNPRPLPAGCEAPRRGGAPHPGRGTGIDSVIRPDFCCNDDTAGGCPNAAPDVAVDGSGNVLVTWYDFREGDADVWFQRLDPAGNPVGANERANDDVGLGWQGEPSCASGARSLMAWHDRREIGNGDLFGQALDNGGNRIGANFRASDSGVPGDQIESGCHVAPDGSALVAWDDRRFGLTGDIFAQFYGPAGNELDTNFRVNDDPVGQANQYQPDVAGDSLGRFAVAWMDGRGHNAYDWNIFMQRFDAARARLGGNIQVTTDDSIQWAPALACSPAGRVIVCWEDRRRQNWDVYAQVYDASGQPVGANFRAGDDPGSTDQFGCGAAANVHDEFLLGWTDRRNGNEDVYARRFDASGNPLGAAFRVNDDAGTAAQNQPAAAAAPDGGWWLVWADSRNGNADVFCQRLDRSGNAVGANFRVSDDRASSQQRVSSIAMATAGQVLVAWEDERNGAADIYSVTLDEAGRPTGPNRRLNDDGPGGAAQYYAAAASGRGRSIVAWSDGRNGYQVYGQMLDAAGLPVGANFQVNSTAPGSSQWYAFCAMDSSDIATVCWMDTRLGTYQMFRRRFGPDGNALGPDESVSDDSTAQGIYGSVAASRSGRVVATWMDYRRGNSDVFCQVFNPDGSRLGANRLVNDDPAGNYHGYPVCAVAEDGSFSVAWEDTRSDGYDVYLQRFDASANPVGANQRVDDGPLEADCYSPSLAMDPDGRLAVMFNDERSFPGCPEVFCQRFRADGSRISGNQRVSDAPLFPHNSHWTVGQSVAASRSALAFAWTDNRRRQGFDIFAKLTDWNLVGAAEQASEWLGVLRFPVLVRRGRRLVLGTGHVAVFDATGRQVEAGRDGLVTLRSAGTYFVVDRGSPKSTHKIVVQ